MPSGYNGPMASPRAVRRPLAAVALVAVVATTAATAVESTPPSSAPPKVHESTVALADGVLDGGATRTVTVTGGPELIAFTWTSAQQPEFQVRAHDGDGWSSWYSVDGDGDEAPDPGSAEASATRSAGPAFLGRDIGEIQVKADADGLRGLVVHAIDSEPTKTDGLVSAAEAPTMVTRSQWGADEGWRDDSGGECDGNPDYVDNIKLAVVHHTDSRNDYTAAESAAIIRGIYDFHVHTNHWCDVAYNFFVDRFGTIFEGRYGGPARAVIGGHTSGFNSVSTGVAVIGDFQSAQVPQAAYDSLVKLLAWKLAFHGVDPMGQSNVTVGSNTSAKWPEGTGVTLANIEGHGDSNKTDCPGQYLEGMLPQLRKDVAAKIGSDHLTPGFQLPRLEGADRFATAAAIAKSTFGKATTAYLARGDAFADALAANYPSGASAAPTLLANTSSVPQVTLDTLKALGVTTIHLLGGTSALDGNVAGALQVAGYSVDRVAGADRYGTAASIAQAAGPGGVGTDAQGRKTAVLSSGAAFPDALAAGGIVFGKHFPQLLTDPTTLSGPTATALSNLGIQHVLLTGGTSAVSQGVEDAVRGMGIAVDRVAGGTRYDTAVALSDLAIDFYGFTPTTADFATGGNFPDALTGGAHAGSKGAPLLLVPPRNPGATVCGYLQRRAVTSGTIFGGRAAVDSGARYGLQECISPG